MHRFDGTLRSSLPDTSELLTGFQLAVQDTDVIALGTGQDIQGNVGQAKLGGTLVVAVMGVAPGLTVGFQQREVEGESVYSSEALKAAIMAAAAWRRHPFPLPPPVMFKAYWASTRHQRSVGQQTTKSIHRHRYRR